MFVRNLPYTCSDGGLEEAFSEIGPVKECFIIADKGAGGKSKGFGFVHFALAEDAAAAVAKSGSFRVDGRAVTIDIAKQKPSARGAGRGGDKDRADAGAHVESSGGGSNAARVNKTARGKGETSGGGDEDEDGDSDSDAPKAKAASAGQFGRSSSAAARSERQQRFGGGGGGGQTNVHPALKDAAKAARTVAIGGLRLAGEPDGIDPEAALASVRACGEVREVVSPAPADVVAAAKLRHDGCTRGVILAEYASAEEAKAAVARLHRTFPGVGKRKQQRLKARLAEGGKAAAAAQSKSGGGSGPEAAEGAVEMIWARQLGGCEGAKPKSWRVIIRNLAFKATDEDILKALGVAGFVWDLNVPRDFHRKPKGFAFAAFTSKADAEAAVEKVNGANIAGRPVAVDWALSKHSYAEAQHKVQEKAAEDSEEEEEEEESDEQDSDGEESDKGSSGEESKSDDDVDVDSGSSSDDDDGDDDEDEDGGDDDEDDEGEAEAEEEDGDAMMRRVMNMVMADPEAEETGKKKPASRKEAREAAKAERIARAAEAREAAARDKAKRKRASEGSDDEDDEQPPPLPGKGGARPPPKEGASIFIRDLPSEASKQMLYERMQKFGKVRSCRLVVDKATGRAKGTAFVDFYDPSAASSAVETAAKVEGGGVKVAGRRLSLALAVSASEAAGLAAAKAKEDGKGRRHRDGPRDNRNLYLASEGQIHEEGSAAQGVSQGDIQKRRRAKEEQAMKLKNPNFFISKTRLQVRNVPLDVDQKKLKSIFVEAVKRRATQANPRVLHAKLLYDPTRPDANGKPRSRGIGFVEFDEHEHALAALRSLNNNPDVFTAARRPIVEFAVEDARAVRKLERRRDGLQKAQQARDGARQAQVRADKNAPSQAGRGARGLDAATSKTQPAGKQGHRGGEKGREHGGRGGGDAHAADEGKGKKGKGKRGEPDDGVEQRREKKQKTEEKLPSAKSGVRARNVFEVDEDGGAPASRRNRRGEKRDATDDLIDRCFDRGQGGKEGDSSVGGKKRAGGDGKKSLGRWFDY